MRNNVQLGGVTVMTDEQINEFSLVSTDDIELMRTMWQRYAGRRYTDLIDAQPQEEVLDINVAA